MHHSCVLPRPAMQCPPEEWPNPQGRSTVAPSIKYSDISWSQILDSLPQVSRWILYLLMTWPEHFLLWFFFFCSIFYINALIYQKWTRAPSSGERRGSLLPFSCSSSPEGLSGVRHLGWRGCPRALNENYPLPAWKVAEINKETPSLAAYQTKKTGKRANSLTHPLFHPSIHTMTPQISHNKP